MKVYLEDLLDGMQVSLRQVKQADSFFDSAHQTFFPFLDKQTKWKYSRTKDSLRLHDGQTVYHFSLPSYPIKEDTKLTRHTDVDSADFEKDSIQTGMAQVHRADPGSIYMTLQDGKDNPTFRIEHESENFWRLIPKKKEKAAFDVDPDDFIKGAELEFKRAGIEDIANGIGNGVVNAGKWAYNDFLDKGNNPWSHAAVSLASSAGLDLLRRKYFLTPTERAYEDQHPSKRLGLIYGLPLALSLGTSALSKNVMLPGTQPLPYSPLWK